MLEKKTILDRIEIESNGTIFVRELNQIVEDGVVISSAPHRTCFTPDADIETLPEVIKVFAQVKWTADVVKEYKDKLKKD